MIDQDLRREILPGKTAEDTLYIGTRTQSGPCVVVQTLYDKSGLQPRLDLVRHSPAGFDWANGAASGSAQLALALLAHASGDDRFALEHYQVFNHEIIRRLAKFRWELSATQILQMLQFVGRNPQPPGAASSPLTSRETATIEALLPNKTYRVVVTAQGSRRNVRKAAKRALLNVLSSQQLRRRRIHHLEIEISVISSCQAENFGEVAIGHVDAHAVPRGQTSP
ncbi:MAG TPA: DUF6166 domain-containing protein [Candidatus Angelobacter sp.]